MRFQTLLQVVSRMKRFGRFGFGRRCFRDRWNKRPLPGSAGAYLGYSRAVNARISRQFSDPARSKTECTAPDSRRPCYSADRIGERDPRWLFFVESALPRFSWTRRDKSKSRSQSATYLRFVLFPVLLYHYSLINHSKSRRESR